MVTEHQKLLIIDLYNNNTSIAKISKQIGISAPTVSKILKLANIEIKKHNYCKIDLDVSELNRLYTSGKTTYELASMFKCSDETIRKHIIEIKPINDRNKRSSESILKIKNTCSKLWKNHEYKLKVTTATQKQEYKDALSVAGKANYSSGLGNWIKQIENKLVISANVKELWRSDEYRNKQEKWYQYRTELASQASKLALEDPIKRREWIRKLRKSSSSRLINNGWVSSTQKQLYYILSASNIDYHEEGHDTQIGPFYVVDCVIPKQQSMLKPLIVEVQGEYWHSLPHVALKDRQKETYVRNHTDFDLLKLEELELSSYSQVAGKLAQYGILLESDRCAVKDLQIKQINESEAQMFYSIFHYSCSVRKGATTFGAYLNDKLVATISYTYPIRTESATRLGYELKEVMEISRLARKTNLICKNLASYLIASTRTKLKDDVKCVISFSDNAYGHLGTVYKASGFVNDGETGLDYFYLSMFGRYHKKTIWDKSKRMRLSESEYAIKHGLLKINGPSKTRWVYRLKK